MKSRAKKRKKANKINSGPVFVVPEEPTMVDKIKKEFTYFRRDGFISAADYQDLQDTLINSADYQPDKLQLKIDFIVQQEILPDYYIASYYPKIVALSLLLKHNQTQFDYVNSAACLYLKMHKNLLLLVCEIFSAAEINYDKATQQRLLVYYLGLLKEYFLISERSEFIALVTFKNRERFLPQITFNSVWYKLKRLKLIATVQDSVRVKIALRRASTKERKRLAQFYLSIESVDNDFFQTVRSAYPQQKKFKHMFDSCVLYIVWALFMMTFFALIIIPLVLYIIYFGDDPSDYNYYYYR